MIVAANIPSIVASVLPMPFVNRPVFGTTGSTGVEPGYTICNVMLICMFFFLLLLLLILIFPIRSMHDHILLIILSCLYLIV